MESNAFVKHNDWVVGLGDKESKGQVVGLKNGSSGCYALDHINPLYMDQADLMGKEYRCTTHDI